ncbi:hypothetical protein GW17_00038848 [Ensete ventricosum]|nr:hypothetical protein GW17_00038848 [Ensete ventricosum]
MPRDAPYPHVMPLRPLTRRAKWPRPGALAPVAVERPSVGPVIVPCDPGEGGRPPWYKRRLRMDEYGDVADEFLSEVIQAADRPHHLSSRRSTTPKFQPQPPWYKRRLRMDEYNQIAPPKFQA